MEAGGHKALPIFVLEDGPDGTPLPASAAGLPASRLPLTAYARSTSLVATTGTPVPAQSGIITSPICTGAWAFTP